MCYLVIFILEALKHTNKGSSAILANGSILFCQMALELVKAIEPTKNKLFFLLKVVFIQQNEIRTRPIQYKIKISVFFTVKNNNGSSNPHTNKSRQPFFFSFLSFCIKSRKLFLLKRRNFESGKHTNFTSQQWKLTDAQQPSTVQ